jgi:CheY-like chemotaxis protein
MRILFVENHELFARTVIEQFLALHDVVVAPTVAAAREAIAGGGVFDVILVDYDLPDGKGTDVVRAIRLGGFRGRVVAVSSKEEGNDDLRRAGANVVCAKKDFRAIREAIY